MLTRQSLLRLFMTTGAHKNARVASKGDKQGFAMLASARGTPSKRLDRVSLPLATQYSVRLDASLRLGGV
jgi:hypothetical protein